MHRRGVAITTAADGPRERTPIVYFSHSEVVGWFTTRSQATNAYSFFVRLYGHRGSCTGARQLVGHKGGVFKRLFDRSFYFMAHRHARCAKCACAADATFPRCKCNQHRRRRRRWYPNATGAVGHVEPLGTVAARAVFSSNPQKCSKLLLSISAPAFKDF
jgi:hypothetical protein